MGNLTSKRYKALIVYGAGTKINKQYNTIYECAISIYDRILADKVAEAMYNWTIIESASKTILFTGTGITNELIEQGSKIGKLKFIDN